MYEDFAFRKISPPHTKRSGSRKSFGALLVILILLIVIVIVKKNDTQPISITSPVANQQNQKLPQLRALFNSLGSILGKKTHPDSNEELLSIIKSIIEKQKAFYSVYIYDLSTSEGFGFNETTIITAASVNKLPILASLYYLAQAGTIDLDERITIQESDIQDYGTGILRYEGAGVVYSIKTLAQLLTAKSDNTAAYILGEQKIGMDTINELMSNWGLTQTDIINNKTSNKDMALLLSKMYQGKIANQALTQEMMGFLTNSDFENRIPRYIPKDVKVYHKIGNEIGNIHDVGIVALTNYPYYIGVLTNDITDEEEVEDTIAKISKVVFEFYSGKKVPQS